MVEFTRSDRDNYVCSSQRDNKEVLHSQGYGEGYILELNTAVKKVKKACPRKVYRPAAMTSAIKAMTSFGVEAIFLGA